VLRFFSFQKSLESLCLRFPPFLCHRLLVNIQGNPAIGTPKEFLNRLDPDVILSEQVGKPIAEGMPADLLVNLQALQNRADVPS
jgi:hypothetical protein